MAERLSQTGEVVPAVAHGMIFEDELGGHRGSEAEGKRSGAIEFLVAEGSDCISRFSAVMEE